jgi:hypothetical protein
MTVTTLATKPRRVQLTGNGVLTDFDFDFKIYENTEVLVYQIDTDSVATLQTITTDYTVTFDTAAETGTISFVTPPTNLYKVLMIGNSAYKQAADIPIGGGFSETVIEKGLDRLAIQIQQLKELVDRAVSLPDTSSLSSVELPDASASKLIGWNAGADALENKAVTSISSEIDITLGGSDAGKLVAVNAASNGYEVRTPNDYTDTVIVAADEILFGDASAGNAIKKDTVQGILDLVPDLDINGKTSATITASDEIILADADDSNALKKDTVQGILDLVSTTGAIKGWVSFDASSGTPTIKDHYNVASITDNGAGDFTIVWDTDFANANYAVVGTTDDNCVMGFPAAFATTGTQVRTRSGGTLTDLNRNCVIAIGDQ